MDISKDCGTLFLTDCGIFPQTDSNMKLAVMPRKANEIKELVNRYKADNLRLRAVVNHADIETLARELGFEIGCEGIVRLTKGFVILVRRADNYLIKEDSLDDLLEHFTFSLVVGA